jgi:hypothetical protein
MCLSPFSEKTRLIGVKTFSKSQLGAASYIGRIDMHTISAVILISVAVSVGSGLAAGPSCPDPATGKLSQAKAPKHDMCPAPAASDVDGGTKAALACEWIDTKSVRHVLEALRYYTNPVEGGQLLDPNDAKRGALYQLAIGDPTNEQLYVPAQGDPDSSGRPQAQGLPDILDDLAEANTLNQQKDTDDEIYLFQAASSEVGEIFASARGKKHLMLVKDLFANDKHAALYELLKAYPGYSDDPDETATQDYACKLEVLRAAYQMRPERLAKAVADKISKSKK